MTDTRGLLRDKNDENSLIPVVNHNEVSELIASGVISGGMIPKIECCVQSLVDGVKKSVIIDGRIPHAILIEMLSDEGIGTLFQKEE
jgi:acetylglutamate kinase